MLPVAAGDRRTTARTVTRCPAFRAATVQVSSPPLEQVARAVRRRDRHGHGLVPRDDHPGVRRSSRPPIEEDHVEVGRASGDDAATRLGEHGDGHVRRLDLGPRRWGERQDGNQYRPRRPPSIELVLAHPLPLRVRPHPTGWRGGRDPARRGSERSVVGPPPAAEQDQAQAGDEPREAQADDGRRRCAGRGDVLGVGRRHRLGVGSGRGAVVTIWGSVAGGAVGGGGGGAVVVVVVVVVVGGVVGGGRGRGGGRRRRDRELTRAREVVRVRVAAGRR